MSSNGTISEKLEQCVLKLHDVGVVKFGDFTLKSGMQSPVYFDLRIITSFPKLLCTVSELLWSVSPTKKFDHVCGVAYTGIPLATVISQMKDLPMVVRRKESKSYGTKKLVEGVYSPGDTCLIVEDVLVSGSSVYETVETLRDLHLEVSDAVVFLDREQGAVKNLSALGVNVVSVLTLTTMLSILQSYGRVSASVSKDVEKFITSHNNTSIVTQKLLKQTVTDSSPCPRLSVPYSARARLTQHPVTRRLFTIMANKRTNLCVAADVDTAQELLAVAREVGPHVCLLKTHVDALDDFTPAVAEQLQAIAKEEDFLLFEDSKFVDIGATVSRQYRRKALWADVVTAAPVLGGEGVLRGLAEGTGGCKDKGVILVTEMSSEGALRSADYALACRKYAYDHPYLVLGFVSQTSATADPRLLQLTPGVHHSATGDSLGQRYTSPAVAVQQRGADIVIVGRGVTTAEDRAAAAKKYQTVAYEAYERRLSVTDEQV